MAAPSALTLFQSFKAYIGDGTFDLDTDTIKVALFTSALTPNVATQSVLADISSNEVANGNGYATGGVALTSCTFTQTAGTAAFKSGNNPSWTGSGAGFAARYAVLYKAGNANGRTNPLIGYITLDSAPADVSFGAGNTVNLTMNAAGWFTLT